MRRPNPILRWIVLLVLVAAVILFARFTSVGRAWIPSSFDDLRALPDRIRAFAPFDQLAYVLLYTFATLLLVPGTVLSFLGATLFGTWLGTALTWTGALIGSTLVYCVVRFLGRDYTRTLADRLLGGRFSTLDRWIERNGFQALLLVRLLPIFPFNGVNFAAGLTSIRFWPFVFATALGILPGTFVYQYLFANIGRRVLHPGDVTNWELVLPVALFLAFLLVATIFARRLKPSTNHANTDRLGLKNGTVENNNTNGD